MTDSSRECLKQDQVYNRTEQIKLYILASKKSSYKCKLDSTHWLRRRNRLAFLCIADRFFYCQGKSHEGLFYSVIHSYRFLVQKMELRLRR